MNTAETPAKPRWDRRKEARPAELIAAARKKRMLVKGEAAARLVDLADRLETAVRDGDAKLAAKLDTELTDLLFELD